MMDVSARIAQRKHAACVAQSVECHSCSRLCAHSEPSMQGRDEKAVKSLAVIPQMEIMLMLKSAFIRRLEASEVAQTRDATRNKDYLVCFEIANAVFRRIEHHLRQCSGSRTATAHLAKCRRELDDADRP